MARIAADRSPKRFRSLPGVMPARPSRPPARNVARTSAASCAGGYPVGACRWPWCSMPLTPSARARSSPRRRLRRRIRPPRRPLLPVTGAPTGRVRRRGKSIGLLHGLAERRRHAPTTTSYFMRKQKSSAPARRPSSRFRRRHARPTSRPPRLRRTARVDHTPRQRRPTRDFHPPSRGQADGEHPAPCRNRQNRSSSSNATANTRHLPHLGGPPTKANYRHASCPWHGSRLAIDDAT